VKKQYAVPKVVTIGKRKIKIGVYDSVFVGSQQCRGAFYWEDGKICVSKQAATDQHNTLWHEITHAILYDMGKHKLNRDEEFVSGFANRLEQAIRTAKF
jgi:hypothetical protein